MVYTKPTSILQNNLIKNALISFFVCWIFLHSICLCSFMCLWHFLFISYSFVWLSFSLFRCLRFSCVKLHLFLFSFVCAKLSSMSFDSYFFFFSRSFEQYAMHDGCMWMNIFVCDVFLQNKLRCREIRVEEKLIFFSTWSNPPSSTMFAYYFVQEKNKINKIIHNESRKAFVIQVTMWAYNSRKHRIKKNRYWKPDL